jgi:hypothetical protein
VSVEHVYPHPFFGAGELAIEGTVNGEHVPVAEWCEGLSHRELSMALGSWAASLDATEDYPSLAQLLREAARRIGGDAL